MSRPASSRRCAAPVDHHQVARGLEAVFVVEGEPAADVDQVVLPGAHPGAVGVAAELLQNLGDALAGVPRLALLHEVGVLHHPGGVEVGADAVAVGERPHRLDVFRADRLAAGHVDRAGHADVGDLLGAHPAGSGLPAWQGRCCP